RAIHRHRIRHPVVLDSEHTHWGEHAVNAWPTIIVLDAQGRVAWKKSGEVDREELGRIIDKLLAEPSETRNPVPVPAPLPDRSSNTLSFPGKVHVFPEAQAQALREDPFEPD